MRICRRYHADGTRCDRSTDHADGWCRTAGCDGFRTPERPPDWTDDAGPERRPALWGAGSPPLAADEAYEVVVSRAARRQFAAAHGGTEAEAEAEIRSMLEDFLLRRRWRSNEAGGWTLSWRSYSLGLSSDSATITYYKSYHAERSYSQVKSGVPSRVSTAGPSGRGWRLPADYLRTHRQPAAGPVLEPGELRAVDPGRLHLTLRGLRALHRRGLLRESDEATLAAIGPELGRDLRDGEIERTDTLYLVHGPALVWRISLDGAMLVDAKNSTALI